MKYLYLLIALILLSSIANAQGKRVIGLSTREWINWNYTDSVTYTYSGNRGHNLLSPETTHYITGYNTKTTHDRHINGLPPKEQEVLEYDAANNITVKATLNWNAGNWLNIRRYLYAYDNVNHTTIEAYQTWSGNVWETLSRSIYTYDENNNQLRVLLETLRNGLWEKNIQLLYTYNASNYMLSSTRQDRVNGNWENQYRYIYTYDANNNQLSETLQNWLSNIWLPNERTLMAYNSDNKMTQQARQKMIDGNWTNLSRVVYTYDVPQKMVNTTDYWANNAWNSEFRSTTIYTTTAKIDSFYFERLEGSNWIKTTGNTYTYTPDNKRLSKADINWDLTLGRWQLDYTYQYLYDTDGYWLGEDAYRQLGDTAELRKEIRYFYETYTPTGIAEAASISSLIYPNPATQNTLLTFQTTQSGIIEFCLFDLNGQQLQTTKQHYPAGSNSLLIDLRNYASGIYLYQIRNADGSTGQGKILKSASSY